MFRQVTDKFYAAPQIDVGAVTEAKRLGIVAIVNNRPDDEDEGQIAGSEIERAAREAGISYTAIPVTHAGFSEAQVDALIEALDGAQGPVLGFCRSGTRSTLLWALARAKQGHDPEEIAADAASAGYDIAPVRQLVDMLAARSNSTES